MIDEIIKAFFEMYSEQIKDKISLDDIERLKPEQQASIHKLLAAMKNFKEVDECFEVNMIEQYIESQIAMIDMEEIPNKIDAMFRGEATFDEVERMIMGMPETRFISVNDAVAYATYQKYCDSLYRFMLYATFIGRTRLFEIDEVKKIVNNKMQQEIISLYGEERYSMDIRDAILRIEGKSGLPLELKQAIIDSQKSEKKYKYINPELLEEMYAYKADFAIYNAEQLEEYDKEKAEEKKIKGRIIENTEYFKKRSRRLAVATLAGIIVYGAPLFLGTKAGLYMSKDDQYKPYITINGTEEQTTSFSKLKFVDKDINLEDTTRRYVTVFKNKDNGKVEIKVYDYTDSSISNTQLKTIDLDDERVIYCDTFEANSRKVKNSEDYFAGIYTGEDHRDIAMISFKTSKPLYVLESFFMIPFMCYGFEVIMVILNVLLGEFFDFPLIYEEIEYLFHDVKKYYNENKRDKAELKRILEKVKSLESTIKLHDIQQEKLKAIEERNRVDEELESLHPMNRH